MSSCRRLAEATVITVTTYLVVEEGKIEYFFGLFLIFLTFSLSLIYSSSWFLPWDLIFFSPFCLVFLPLMLLFLVTFNLGQLSGISLWICFFLLSSFPAYWLQQWPLCCFFFLLLVLELFYTFIKVGRIMQWSSGSLSPRFISCSHRLCLLTPPCSLGCAIESWCFCGSTPV